MAWRGASSPRLRSSPEPLRTSWTGPAERSSPGGCQTRWTPAFASRHWRRRSPAGSPEIFNTDQGSQFTSFGFTAVLAEAGVRISMDGRGRCMDNIFIERLWRSMKYECAYLNSFETGSELRAGLTRWISYYNTARPHSALAGRTPDEAYDGGAQVGTAERQLAA